MRSSLEEVDEEVDSIREVDTAIAVEVQQNPVPRIADSAILAGKPPWCSKEEMPEKTDGIGEVDLSILVRVARPLQPTRSSRPFRQEIRAASRREPV